jgi:hypothetical protein
VPPRVFPQWPVPGRWPIDCARFHGQDAGHFVSRESCNDPQLEEIAVARSEASEGSAHPLMINADHQSVDRLWNRSRWFDRHRTPTAIGDSLLVDDDVMEDSEAPRLGTHVRCAEPAEALNHSGEGLRDGIARVVGRIDPTLRVGKHPRVHAVEQGLPGVDVAGAELWNVDDRLDRLLQLHPLHRRSGAHVTNEFANGPTVRRSLSDYGVPRFMDCTA